MIWAWLFLLAGLALGVDLNQIKNDALNYANQGSNISTNTKNRTNNIICTQGGADCSYQGQDYENFSQESQARQEYLNQANDPNSVLGRSLSTIWSTSDIKSTLFYQEATKLYQCDRVSPDGRCERYVGESYYGECQTVMECVSQTTQQSYAEYMCYVDSQGQNTAGESRYLCYVYNQIEPAVKEKEYVCYVVNTESIRTCNKSLQVNFGQCVQVGDSVHSVSIDVPYYGETLRFTISFSGNTFMAERVDIGGDYYYRIEINFSQDGNYYAQFPYHCHGAWGCERVSAEWYQVQNGRIVNCQFKKADGSIGSCYCPSGTICDSWDFFYETNKNIFGFNTMLIAYAELEYLNDGGKRARICKYVNWYVECTDWIYSGERGYKCSLNNQTYTSKSECYANCYTESVNDCAVQ